MTTLDPRFAKILAKMRSTPFEPEKVAARMLAERIAIKSGLTFDEAISIMDGKRSNSTYTPGRTEPSRQEAARREAERRRAEQVRIWKAKKTAIVKRYGSTDRVFARCECESRLVAAVSAWRTVVPGTSERTSSLDGWRGWTRTAPLPPQRVVDAICKAYRLPESITEALKECDYWALRDADVAQMLCEGGRAAHGNTLDLVILVRLDIVRELAERKLPLRSVAELRERFRRFQAPFIADQALAAALLQDLEDLSHLSASDDSHVDSIARMIGNRLKQDPSISDRRLARELNCSPTTVGKIRKDLGLSGNARSVHRGGRTYTMKAAVQKEPRQAA
ncbi:hypothetical protein D3273_24295 [Lichenibacterium minor]|uniref:Uncharacterized protein n=1 Tax=Lichenibacterium minor TaxID=2316528 RepID=A0A4Q2U3P5_9HYPH|nr:hypothetical protein [Lichenibacterium minor]RYC29365.1 hypothetical protein D3273_24295 [Lichenibacterium minor]